MTQDKAEAELIARLLADDRKRKVGLVYLWNTSELGILWIEKQDAASFIEPPLHPELLAKAKSETPVEVIDLLAALSTKAGNDPG